MAVPLCVQTDSWHQFAMHGCYRLLAAALGQGRVSLCHTWQPVRYGVKWIPQKSQPSTVSCPKYSNDQSLDGWQGTCF